MKHLKFLVGLVALAVMGFIGYAVLTGIGALIALMFITHSWQMIISGTLLGMISIVAYSMSNDKK